MIDIKIKFKNISHKFTRPQSIFQDPLISPSKMLHGIRCSLPVGNYFFTCAQTSQEHCVCVSVCVCVCLCEQVVDSLLCSWDNTVYNMDLIKIDTITFFLTETLNFLLRAIQLFFPS